MYRIAMILSFALGTLAPAAALSTSLPGHYHGRGFGNGEPCEVQIDLQLGRIFRQPYLRIRLDIGGESLEYVAKVAALEKTLREGHHGADMAYAETSRGFLQTVTDYAYMRVVDGAVQDMTLDHTEANAGWVTHGQQLSCGNLVKAD